MNKLRIYTFTVDKKEYEVTAKSLCIALDFLTAYQRDYCTNIAVREA